MKFKKVEIQAFRAYDQVKDATFDFSLKDGEDADFVSLFAPNGFGKTSFYDAVEYGVTKNINRFLKRQGVNKDSAKSERSMGKKKPQYILRNRHSAADLETFIKIYTTENPDGSETKVKRAINGGSDYKFEASGTVNPEFQMVILSQEWIDGFLREDSAVSRYDSFIRHFGDIEIDKYHKTLTDLIAQNEKNIQGLKKELKEKKSDLSFDGDLEILQKINEKIALIKAMGVTLNRIEVSFTEKDILDIENKVAEHLSDFKFSIEKETILGDDIEAAVNGGKNTRGLKAYFAAVNKMTVLNKTLTTAQELLKKFNERAAKIVEATNIEKTISKKISEGDILRRLLLTSVNYKKIEGEVANKKAALQKNDVQIVPLREQLGAAQAEDAVIKMRLDDLQMQALDNDKKLEEYPKKLVEESKTRTDLEKATTGMEAQRQILEALAQNLDRPVALIKHLKNMLKILRGNLKFPNLKNVADKYNSQINEVKQNETAIKNLVLMEQFSADRMKEQTKFQKEIEIFIAKGAQLIAENKTASCPLCLYEYDSYQSLAEKVASNNFLSQLQADLLKEHTKNQLDVKNAEDSTKRKKEELVALILKDIRYEEHALNRDSKARDKALAKLKEMQGAVKLIESKLNRLVKTRAGKTAEAYRAELLRQQKKLRKDLLENRQAADTISRKILSVKEDLQSLQQNNGVLRKEITRLQKDADFTTIVNFFSKRTPGKPINLKLIDSDLSVIQQDLENFQKQAAALRKTIARLEKSLQAHSETAIQKEINLLSNTVEVSQRLIQGFEQYLLEKLSIRAIDYGSKQLQKLLENRRDEQYKKIKAFQNVEKELALLLALKTNVLPYLKYEKLKKQVESIQSKLTFFQETVYTYLYEESRRVSDHLSKQINAFFFEDLINDLYKRIDPHPDYRNIKFQCDFSDEKPRLNVCVSQDGSDEMIIPNLYFSTAQLNILSLSIFLAKALNARDNKGQPINCIFIDDPIQSMDSINILSTIDLLRSLVVNQEKQILLSTHDENFHNLLKKKMPPGLFKSKFIELETFGKVKQD